MQYATINNYQLPTNDVININLINKEVKFSGTALLASTCTVQLNNTDKTKYDDRVTGSLFYGVSFYNKVLVVYDDDVKYTTFVGRVKNITVKGEVVEIEATNYFKDLLDTQCVYTQEDKTPAEHIYSIITTVAALPEYIINYGLFTQTKSYQISNNILCSVVVTKNDNANCLSIIEELCKLGQIILYDDNNIIQIRQWELYDGTLGYRIDNKLYIAKSYQHYYEDDMLYNNVYIAYKSGINVAFHEDDSLSSQTVYGIKKSFVVPDTNINSTSASDYKILLSSLTAATTVGALILNRYKDIRKYCMFKLVKDVNYINLYDVLNLFIEGMVNEPVRVLKINTQNKGYTEYTCEFINLPVQIVEIDKEQPAATTIHSAIGFSDTAIGIVWEKNVEPDLSGYLIYYTAGNNWYGEASADGASPIEIKNPLTTMDGYYYYIIEGLKPGTRYKFKICAFDTSYNYSDDSNIAIGTTLWNYQLQPENMYNCIGNVFFGIFLDVLNSKNGIVTLPYNSDWVFYNSMYYNLSHYSCAAICRTMLFMSLTKYKSFIFKHTPAVKIQYRIFDGLNFSDWSDLFCAGIMTEVYVNAQMVQFQFVFYSLYWTDNDYIYINSIVEE